jgi:hypothetical protein
MLGSYRQDIMDAMIQSDKYEGEFKGFTSKYLLSSLLFATNNWTIIGNRGYLSIFTRVELHICLAYLQTLDVEVSESCYVWNGVSLNLFAKC